MGKLLSDGSVFESTEGKSPLQFTLGEGQVRASVVVVTRKAKAVETVAPIHSRLGDQRSIH